MIGAGNVMQEMGGPIDFAGGIQPALTSAVWFATTAIRSCSIPRNS